MGTRGLATDMSLPFQPFTAGAAVSVASVCESVGARARRERTESSRGDIMQMGWAVSRRGKKANVKAPEPRKTFPCEGTERRLVWLL